MLLWARKNLFVIQSLSVGDVAMSVGDARPPTAGSRTPPPKPQPENIYEEMGGEVWKEAVEEAEFDATESEHEDDPDDLEDDDAQEK